ncbi:hypothetical protein FEM48_Zijuj03G0131400 [Ziziphus jujuba var. spinosa]|uniref:Reverse transcriptase domain-containing protein n=1 Tax=Ziziphus jujuba var. spinosa TaxID=714518 RepID=A0A978VQH3_ZIZJJ|nr:hypothetical protein FEM48_Zijuj03G0131400 [Ziziphus jujuba var. spinosa]
MYADDLLITCHADPQNAIILDKCLKKFCGWSSQMVNGQKSNIFFSKSTSRQDRKVVKEILGFKDMGPKAIYLGNSFIFGRNKTKELYNIKERIKSIIEDTDLVGWGAKMGSFRSKAALSLCSKRNKATKKLNCGESFGI